MLVLAWKKNERIVITTPEGEKVAVTFVRFNTKTGKIRLGIDAPKKWIVRRDELEMPTDETESVRQTVAECWAA